jgi:hypothetical protein
MSKFHKQSESIKALEQSLNDHMEICALKNKVKRLKAKVERLTASTTRTIIPNEELQAQVERLTKAGYAMAIKINVHGINDRFTDSQKLVDDWSNAAKEGKPGV